MKWATRTKNKVHVITPIVEGIMAMEYCRNHRTVARIIGCTEHYVRLIRLQLNSSAHVFLTPEEAEAIK